MNTVLLLFASRRVDAGISTVMVSLIPITILLVDSLAARKLCVSWVGIGGIIGGFAGIAVVVVGSVPAETPTLLESRCCCLLISCGRWEPSI